MCGWLYVNDTFDSAGASVPLTEERIRSEKACKRCRAEQLAATRHYDSEILAVMQKNEGQSRVVLLNKQTIGKGERRVRKNK